MLTAWIRFSNSENSAANASERSPNATVAHRVARTWEASAELFAQAMAERLA